MSDEPRNDIVVSYSELSTFRQCPLKHYLTYIQRWCKPPKEDGALAKGTLWHAVMEEHYNLLKRGIPLAEVAGQVSERFSDPTTGEQSEAQQVIEWMYEGYLQVYGDDPEWEVVAVEHPIRCYLGRSLDHRPIWIKAKLDLIVRNRKDGTLWIWDHKSGANLPDQLDLDMDDQFGQYVWLMRQIKYPVVGALHNAARTKMNTGDKPGYTGKLKPQTLEQRFRRTYLSRSDKELENIARDALLAARAAYNPNPVRYSAPNPRTCSWGCDARDAHLAMRKGASLSSAMLDHGFTINKTRH